MQVREFVRGAYKQLDEPVVITKHNRPVGMWVPADALRQVVIEKLLQPSGRPHPGPRSGECGLPDFHPGKCSRLE